MIPKEGFIREMSRYFRTKSTVSDLGVVPGAEPVDSGSGSTVYRVNVFPYGECALKIFNLPGSEHLTIHGIDAYKDVTNYMSAEVKRYRKNLVDADIVLPRFGSTEFHWRVNPIYETGLVWQDAAHKTRMTPYSLSPWVSGVSLGDIFDKNKHGPADYHPFMEAVSTSFLRQELDRFNRLLRWNEPVKLLNILALNVLVAPAHATSRVDLVITNVREYVVPVGHAVVRMRRGG